MPEFKESKLRPGQRFWRLLKPDAPEIRNVYIYSVFNGLVNLSLPLGIQAIINIQGGQSVDSVDCTGCFCDSWNRSFGIDNHFST